MGPDGLTGTEGPKGAPGTAGFSGRKVIYFRGFKL